MPHHAAGVAITFGSLSMHTDLNKSTPPVLQEPVKSGIIKDIYTLVFGGPMPSCDDPSTVDSWTWEPLERTVDSPPLCPGGFMQI